MSKIDQESQFIFGAKQDL